MFDPANANATGEEEEVERPIEPISDISIDQINSLMFGDLQKRAQQFWIVGAVLLLQLDRLLCDWALNLW